MKILITGGTGSFGKAFIRKALDKGGCEIVVYSRDEIKQWDLMNELGNNAQVRFYQGDVRDADRLATVARGVDAIVHAAATKIVPMAELNPAECIKTNVIGALNVVSIAQMTESIRKVVALSTDKASSPINLYGASKLISDKVILNSNQHMRRPKCSVVRYGNVMGSRGSVIPYFLKLSKEGRRIPLTDITMTRFMVSLDEAVDLVLFALDDLIGGEIYVKKIPSMKLADIMQAIAPDSEFDVIGIRPGEKLHEEMISIDESRYTFDFGSYYKIFPNLSALELDRFANGGKRVPRDYCYRSDTNTEWMSAEELARWICLNKEGLNQI